jgi:hypothetical protein
MSGLNEIPTRFARVGLVGVLSLAVTLLGLGLRVEHALTFDGPGRGADYAVNLGGVHWMLHHWRPFNFTPEVSTQVGYQPPLWFALGAVILGLTGHERPIAWIAVIGWLIRQLLLARILKHAIPSHKWSALAALSIHAVLPLSVLTDGKLNPEGLHSTLFMVALYGLWRVEQEAHTLNGVTSSAAVIFGGFSGLAVLTKATAGILPLLGLVVFVWLSWCVRNEPGGRAKQRQLVRAGALAGLAWCIVAGWWCGPNLVRYGHPFPHIWNLTAHSPVPVLQRRPLGWILPFEWRQYLEFPIMYTDQEPRPNFWATCITGMWSDIYNRGFCRLQGGGVTTHVFGANWGPSYGPEWYVSMRCVHHFVRLVWVGLAISLASILSVGYVAWLNIRTKGRRGSLGLPIAIGLNVFFVMLFALVYPFDDNVVLNPRYLLPAAAPMSACLGMALANIKLDETKKTALHALCLLAIATVGALLVYQRFGG